MTAPPRVSLCMIVKNEEANLPTCLASAADLVDEIIVVDTGSTDRTREVAGQFGARVVEFAWIDDFSAARNESLRHATCPWIFWLDADERLDEDNRQRLRALFASLRDEKAAYLMRQLSEAADGTAVAVDQARLFPRDPAVRWEGRVHEQVLPSIQRLGGRMARTDVVIHHRGYHDPALFEQKRQRNLNLLQREQVEWPNDPFLLLYQALHCQTVGRVAESLPLLRRGLQFVNPTSLLAPRFYTLLTQGLRGVNRGEEAWAVCMEGRARYPEESELLHQEGLLRYERGDLAEAEACLLTLLERGPQALLSHGVDAGLWGHQTRHTLGLIYWSQGDREKAEDQWRAAVAERPDHLPSWAMLTRLWRERGRVAELEQATARLEADRPRSAEATLLRAALLQTRRQLPAARRLLQEGIAAFPQALPLRRATVEVMLEEGDVVAAEAALRGMLALSPANKWARDTLKQLPRRQPRKR